MSHNERLGSDAAHAATATAKKDVQSVIAYWNSRQWAEAAAGLDRLASSGDSLPDVDRRAVKLLRAICASFHGQYKVAKKLFEVLLEDIPFQDEDSIPDDLEISALHWLGDTCLVLRNMDDAALAWSIAWEGASHREPKLTAQKERLLTGLYFLQSGALQGDVLSRRTLGQLSNALAAREKTAIKIFRNMSADRKADYIGSVVEFCMSKQKPETTIPSFEDRTSDLEINEDSFRYQGIDQPANALQFDPFLLLDPRKFQHIAAWGLDVNYAQLDLRFWPNLHQEYQFFSKVPVTSIYSTRKRSLKFIVDSLETELNSRGMLVAHYFDRMKVIRIRNFGKMDYVACFVIVFIRTPLYTIFGVQVPNHLVRTGWEAVHGPEIKARFRVVKELKEILATAEHNVPDTDDPRYRDIIPGSQPRPSMLQQQQAAISNTGSSDARPARPQGEGIDHKLTPEVTVS